MSINFAGGNTTFGLKPVQTAGVLGTAHTRPAIQVFAENPKPGNYVKINYADPSDVGEFVRLHPGYLWRALGSGVHDQAPR